MQSQSIDRHNRNDIGCGCQWLRQLVSMLHNDTILMRLFEVAGRQALCVRCAEPAGAMILCESLNSLAPGSFGYFIVGRTGCFAPEGCRSWLTISTQVLQVRKVTARISEKSVKRQVLVSSSRKLRLRQAPAGNAPRGHCETWPTKL